MIYAVQCDIIYPFLNLHRWNLEMEKSHALPRIFLVIHGSIKVNPCW